MAKTDVGFEICAKFYIGMQEDEKKCIEFPKFEKWKKHIGGQLFDI